MRVAAGLLLIALLSSMANGMDASFTIDRNVERALATFRERVPPRYFDEAYGYVVLPSVKRVGLGLGGAWGRGVVFEQGVPVGRVRLWQLTSGIQTGARAMSLIVFFRDEVAMTAFRENRLLFFGQAGFAVFGLGYTRTPAYRSEVAVFSVDRFGLMIEATIAGGRIAPAR
jgi:lipid-binding SYLF domain-containing protein